jgi:hypothetical protein
MYPFRTELNPAFKTAQPLPMLVGGSTEVRNCSVPIVIPEFPRGSTDKQELTVAAPDGGLTNEAGRLQRFAPRAHGFSRGYPGTRPSFGHANHGTGASSASARGPVACEIPPVAPALDSETKRMD